jgi:signal peptidase I
MRLALYTGARQFAIIFAAGLLIKLFVCDSVKMDGSQMEPALLQGDRMLILKAPYATPIINGIFSHENKQAVVALPAPAGTKTILRVAAVSGDTVSVDNGQFYRNRYASERFRKDTVSLDVIAAEYSPADFMAPYRVPAPKDYIAFGELTLRDLIFAYSALRQEKSNARIKAFAMIGDSIIENYRIENFSFYSGPIDSIPDELALNWFFWDRLQGYLNILNSGGGDDGDGDGGGNAIGNWSGERVQLAFSVFKGKKEIAGFKVKKRYMFLMGDNWTGAKDSRYFGPVASGRVRGRPVMTLWGWHTGEDGKTRFGGGRIFKFVR